MKKLLIISIAAGLFGCNAFETPKSVLIDTARYKVIEYHSGDADTNPLLSERIVLTKPMAKDTLISLLKERFYDAQYHVKPKRLHIYIYNNEVDINKLSDNWCGMIDNQNNEIVLKYTVNPADPITKIEHIPL